MGKHYKHRGTRSVLPRLAREYAAKKKKVNQLNLKKAWRKGWISGNCQCWKRVVLTAASSNGGTSART